MKETKQSLRKRMLFLLRKQPLKERKRKSQKIKELLFKLEDFKRAKKILFYVSKNTEVDTYSMIQQARQMGKEILVPFMQGDQIIPSLILSFEELEESHLGIKQPKKDFFRPVPLEEVDLIIVPGLAFDKEGWRLGRGRGCYDRLLVQKKDLPAIGLAFDFQVLHHLPHNHKDQKLKKVLFA